MRRSTTLALACAGLVLGMAGSASAAVITVNSTGDDVAVDNTCTLREAIIAANDNVASDDVYSENRCDAGATGVVRDTIRFQIPGSFSPASPASIAIGSALPAIDEKVVIDGTTQSGYNGSPVVELLDSSAAPASNGVLVLAAGSDGSLIRGLSISQAPGSAILISDSNGNAIESSYLGLRPNGAAGLVDKAGATLIDASGNRIGSRAEAERNVIGANGTDGITIEGMTSTQNALLGNSIRPNGPAAGDLPIDLNATEDPLLPPFDGDGFSPNDFDDSDTGPNGVQNFPVITAAVPSLSLIQGHLDSIPSTGYRIEIFASSGTGPAGTGLARRLIGVVVAVTNGSGHAEWGIVAAPGAFADSESITATATPQNASGTALGTSEVSLPVEAETCTIEGTAANDTITGTTGNDTICAFGGDDVIDGGGGDDFIVAGGGADTLRGGAGHDSMFGGEGTDVADYSLVSSNVNASLADGESNQDGQGSTDSLSSLESLTGGPVDDILTGDGLANTIDGGGGGDVINSQGADDTATGGLGDDAINGGDGNDRVLGDSGIDILSGGNDSDYLAGGTENDSIDGAAGNDTLLGELGNDTLAGLEGEDVILGDLGNDRLEGGGANDVMNGGPGTDRVDGDRGNDRMQGQGGNDLINGGQGKDRIAAGLGNDRLLGAAASDRMRGGKGNDFLNGGGGTDKLFGDEGRDAFVGGSGKDLCDGGADRDKRRSPGCVTRRSIP